MWREREGLSIIGLPGTVFESVLSRGSRACVALGARSRKPARSPSVVRVAPPPLPATTNKA